MRAWCEAGVSWRCFLKSCDTIHETKLPVRAKVKLYRVDEGDELVFEQELSGELVADGLRVPPRARAAARGAGLNVAVCSSQAARGLKERGDMHKRIVYFAYGWLTFTGTAHFAIDVVSQYLRGVRPPGPEATLYYGLNISFALGQVVLGAIGLWLARRHPAAMRESAIVILSMFAAAAWLAISFLFIEYWPPRINAAIFLAATIAAGIASRGATTSPAQSRADQLPS